MKSKQLKVFAFLFMALTLPTLVFASQDTMFWIQGELFDSATMLPKPNAQMGVDIFTTATCIGSPYWAGTFPSATDVNGVYSLLISNISMDFNKNYYACVYANSSLINSAIPFRAGQGQISDEDVDFTNLYADYFYGDGSGITNITADDLDIDDNEWLYLDTADTRGIRWNSSGNNIEMNQRLYVPNMISANSIDASLGYFEYLQMGYKGFSTGYPFSVINSTGTIKFIIDNTGDMKFLDDSETNYITWNESGIGVWKYSPTQHAMEIWAGSDTEDYIALYNPTEIWGNLTMVSGNVTADYFVGDGSQLTNIPTGVTNHSLLTDLNWSVAGHIMDDDMVFDTGKGIYLDNLKSNGLIYNLSAGGEMQWFGGQIHLMTTHLNLDDGYGVYFGDNGEFSINYDNDPNVNMTVFDDNNQRPAWVIRGITLGDHETLYDGTIYWDGKNLSTWQKYNFTSNRFEFNKNISAPAFIGDGSGLTNLPTSPQYWNRSAPTIYPANFGDDLTLQNGSLYFDKDYFIDWLGEKLTFNNTSDRFEFTDDVYANGNVTASNFLGNLNWSYIQNAPSFITSETDPIWTANSSTVARIGNCTTGQFVMNTTTGGVQCLQPSHSALSNLNWDVAGHIINDNVVPNITNSYSLGNSTLYWSSFYSTNATIGNSTGNTTITPDGTKFFGTAQPTDFLEIESLFTGTSPPATLLISTIGISRAFDDGTDEQLYAHLRMPSRFAGGNVILRYTWLSTTATTGNCVWAVEYRVYKDNELQSGGTATLSETQTTKGTTYNRTTTLGFTIPNVEPTDTLELRIYRDANAGADTLVGDAYLLHTTIEFPISTI